MPSPHIPPPAPVSSTVPGTSRAASLAGWSAHPASIEDDEQVRILFEQVFQHPMSEEQWQWKYADSPLRGILLRKHAVQVVAFFGGMSRSFVGQGRHYRGVQNGDVMVHPSERGVFSRRGALHQVSAEFFGHYVGPQALQPQYDFAFGFPNRRHFDLGIKLGLYEAAGCMMALSWQPQPARWHWGWFSQMLTAASMSLVDTLWESMPPSWPEVFIPVRNRARWTYRYLHRPQTDYTLLLVRSRWTHRPLAALALRQHSEHIEWLDYVGHADHVPCAVQAARAFAFAQGQKRLTALVHDCVAPAFAVGHDSMEPSPICVPVNASSVAAAQKPWVHRLWLMGGDSDFM